MKKIILLTSLHHSAILIDYLRQQHTLLKVFVEEEAAILTTIFKQQFLTTPFEIYSKNAVKSMLSEDVTLIVFGFSKTISKSVYEKAELAFNIHFGNLPEERGPDPLFWALRQGKEKISVTLHLLDEEVDSGSVIATQEVPIEPSDNYGLAFARLSAMVPQVVTPILQGFYKKTEQSSDSNYTSRPDTADTTIDWQNMSSEEINNLVRACNPKYGGAITSIMGSQVRILEVSPSTPSELGKKPGTILEANVNDGLLVMCRDNQTIKLNVLTINEGTFSGARLSSIGVKAGTELK